MTQPRATRTTDQLRLLVDAVSDYAIFLLDLDGRILSWNMGARRIKGYAADEIIGESFERFYTDEDLARDHPRHELEVAAREGRFEEEGWRVRKDGSRFWANVVITALRDETGELIGYGKVTRDLTPRRLAEELLRGRTVELVEANAGLEQFRVLVATVQDYGIFMLDAGGHIQTWNQGAELLKGYTEAEIIGRHFSIFYTDEDRERGHPAEELEVAAREGRYEEEGWRVRKDGSRFWANVVITSVRNEYGILIGYAKVTRDLTERRAAEEELHSSAADLARSNAALEGFAAAAAHDLVEPLHTITGLSDLVRQREAKSLDPMSQEALGHINSAAQRLHARVDGLLEYARTTRGELEATTVVLKDVLDGVIADLRAGIDERQATVRCEGDLGTVRGDPHLLSIVLQNLLVNALKFNEGSSPQVTVSAEDEEGGRRVSVADNGIGVAPEQQERIFRIFGRLHPEERYPGTGMGLALCHQIIERHGGHMGVESAIGVGSRFWFSLPEPEITASA